jgi:hypothetical protein
MTSNDERAVQHRTGRTESRVSRRRLLAAAGLGALSAVAGCTGDGGDGGDGGSGSSPDGSGGGGGSDGGGASPTGAFSCTSVSGEYAAYDAGQTKVVADFEYPTLVAELQESINSGGLVLLEGRRESGDGAQLRFAYRQLTLDGEASSEIGEQVTTIEFAGASHEVYDEGDLPDKTQYGIPLTFDAGGETRYYKVAIILEFDPASGNPSESCTEALDEVALHAAESLSRNPDAELG